MNLSEKQIELLKKYNIDYEVDSIDNLLINVDLVMTDYLDKNYEPTKDFLVLEKLYDEIYDLEITEGKNGGRKRNILDIKKEHINIF